MPSKERSERMNQSPRTVMEGLGWGLRASVPEVEECWCRWSVRGCGSFVEIRIGLSVALKHLVGVVECRRDVLLLVFVASQSR